MTDLPKFTDEELLIIEMALDELAAHKSPNMARYAQKASELSIGFWNRRNDRARNRTTKPWRK